jgi:hypothetical protein
MRARYDEKNDQLNVRIASRGVPATTVEVATGVRFLLGEKLRLLAVEVEKASTHFGPSLLRELQRSGTMKRSGVSRRKGAKKGTRGGRKRAPSKKAKR